MSIPLKPDAAVFVRMECLLTFPRMMSLYVKVKPEGRPEIIEKHIKNGQVVERLLFVDPSSGPVAKSSGIIFFSKQIRTSLF
jgi:(2Fe-2S) ferredoxin